MTFLFLAALASIAIGFVLYPVFDRNAGFLFNQSKLSHQIQTFGEQKAQLYQLLKDLDFEKDEGKISEEDYVKARNDYMEQVASIINHIDELTPSKQKPVSTATTREPTEEVSSCKSCGNDSPLGAQFCMSCGISLEPTRTCQNCSAELPSRARFCRDCGTGVAT